MAPRRAVAAVAMNKETWATLTALQPRLRRFAYGLSGSLDEADDLVQAAYERAISRIHQWQAGTRLDSWMYRIVQSIYINRQEANRVRGSHLKPVDPDTLRGRDEVRAIEASMTLAKVRGFISRLPEEQRAALLLVAIEGLSYKDAADVLNLPVGTLTSRVARARVALREYVDGSAAPSAAAGGASR